MSRQMVEAGAVHSDLQGFGFPEKRVFDLIMLVPILLLTAPLMLLVALAVWILDGSPILFRQTRIGRGGTPFELLKFRTMREASDAAHREYISRWIAQGHQNGSGHPRDRLCERDQACSGDQACNRHRLYKMTNDPRVTRLGGILRRFSLDELPQLINVLRGEMSLIGPRPAIAYEVALYQDWHRQRLSALPGLTGLWQVSGRNRLSFDEMVRLDIDYIDHWSLARDLEILARTPRAVLQGDGR